MSASIQIPRAPNTRVLSIAIIGPDERLRKTLASEIASCQSGPIQEHFSYPPGLHHVQNIVEQNFDAIFIDLESEPEFALELAENIGAHSSATVIAYAPSGNRELLMRCMRAGVREFVTVPGSPGVMAETLGRVSVNRPAVSTLTRAAAKLFVFLGAKGGSGVTTVACNFAVALAHDFRQNTLLIDLDLPLGDAALNLGIDSEYSTVNALEDSSRLDSNFLSGLLVRHSSSLQVLAAPGKFPSIETLPEAIDKLLAVARQTFTNVVVDAGARLDLSGTALLSGASTVYLVTQGSIPELRNSNRLISELFPAGGPRLEIVLNRSQPGTLEIDEEQVAKELAWPVNWAIPSNWAVVRQMQNTATPLVLKNSPISQVIRQMASSACGLPLLPQKKKRFGFFR
jgi:pilus assembly protein CpaE